MLFYAGICQKDEQKKLPQNTCKARNINTFKRFQDMTKILYVCHGNICRSPMAEFVMKDLVKKAGLESEFLIESAATSTEEIGNPVYPPARRELARHGIDCTGKTARQLRKADYGRFDLLIGMDKANLRDMRRICGGDLDGKLHLLMEYAAKKGLQGEPGGTGRVGIGGERDGSGLCCGEVADPWYTGDFETTWRDVLAGCQGLLDILREQKQ